MKEEIKSLDKYFHYAKQGYDIDAIVKDNGWSADKRWGNDETDKLMEMYRKSHMIPGSMFDDVVEDWYDKQVHVGTARLATASTETRNMMLLLC